MAFVTGRSGGGWEIRESYSTPAGPRSRTLASFRVLTPAVIERAGSRAQLPFDPAAVHRAARRAGAPIAPSPSDRASAELIAELAAGRRPRPPLARLLIEAMQGGAGGSHSDNAQAAAAWVVSTPKQRGDTLGDLLLLADRLPRPAGRRERPRFPRIRSSPA